MSDTGHKLELSQASTKLAEAVAAGDAEALRRAADDHATALNSQATAMAASIAAPVYDQLTEIKDLMAIQARQSADSAQLQDERFGYILKQFGAYLEKEDQRHDHANDELSKITEALGGLRGDNQALQAEFRDGLSGVVATVSSLAETVDGMQEDRQAVHEEIAAVKADVVTLQTRLDEYIAGSRRSEVDTLKAQVGELIAERDKYTPQQRQRMTDAFMRMLTEWMAAHPDEAHGDGES